MTKEDIVISLIKKYAKEHNLDITAKSFDYDSVGRKAIIVYFMPNDFANKIKQKDDLLYFVQSYWKITYPTYESYTGEIRFILEVI